ncbi:hypothetical protein HN51_056747 [Arachis hypogaea]
MAPFLIFRLLISSTLLLLLAMADDGECPSSFQCGSFGTIKFPFTDSRHPHCGVMPIHGCDDPNPDALKTIQLTNTTTFTVLYVEPHTITIKDINLYYYLRSKSCKTFSNNITLPRIPTSPLGSFYIKYNITLFRCNKSLTLNLPRRFHNYRVCPDYNIYYGPPNEEIPKGFQWPTNLTACSNIQLPLKDESDTSDPFSFLSDEMQLEVLLSDDCANCVQHQSGQCQLDTQGKFYCAKSPNSLVHVLPDILNTIYIPLSPLLVGIALPLFTIIGLLLILWRCKAKCGIVLYSNPEPESCSVYFGVPVFSYKDLQVATKYFDPSRVLGDGGFGTVYYGKLKDGREVAIKHLYEHNSRRLEQFMNEVKILTRLRHVNLVSLYGCTSYHSHELLLVYEYIPNGTLASHLHHGSSRSSFLPWPIRIKVAIETATALAYLHASDIIHRDVKTNNILLDNSYCVKVADFGMSRLFPNDVTHVSTAPQGTPGYLDPEYHQFYQLTSKSDVYSFGVVLIELISSKPAVDMSRHKDEISLANLAINKIRKGAIGELVDPFLGFESDSGVRREIVMVAELAFQCLQRDRELRPSMEEVLEALRRTESGKEEAKVSDGDVLSAEDDEEEMKVLNGMKATPSPKAVTDKWDSESSITPNISSQSTNQSNVDVRISSLNQEK